MWRKENESKCESVTRAIVFFAVAAPALKNPKEVGGGWDYVIFQSKGPNQFDAIFFNKFCQLLGFGGEVLPVPPLGTATGLLKDYASSTRGLLLAAKEGYALEL